MKGIIPPCGGYTIGAAIARKGEGVLRRAFVAVYVHLVWATWDRSPLLDAAIEREVHRAIEAKATALGADVLAIGGVEDHVHLLVRLPTTLTIAALVGGVKGASAHLVNHGLRPGESFQWQGSYAAFSVGRRQLATVKDYIGRQREHHALGGSPVGWEAAIFATMQSATDTTTPARKAGG